MKNSLSRCSRSILNEFGPRYVISLLTASFLAVLVGCLDIAVITIVGKITYLITDTEQSFLTQLPLVGHLPLQSLVIILFMLSLFVFASKVIFLNYSIKLAFRYGNRYVEACVRAFLRNPKFANSIGDVQFTNLIVHKGSSLTMSFINGQILFITNLFSLIAMLLFTVAIGGNEALVAIAFLAAAYIMFGSLTARSIDGRSNRINSATNNLFGFTSEISFLFSEILALKKENVYTTLFSKSLNKLRQLQRANLLVANLPRYFLDLLIYSSMALALFFITFDSSMIDAGKLVMLLFTFQKSVPFFQSTYAGWVQMRAELSFISDLVSFKNKLQVQSRSETNLQGFDHLKFVEFQVGSLDSSFPLNSPVSFSVRRNELILIKGKSGAGKSSILKFFLGITSMVSGNMMVDGRSTSTLPELSFAFVGQSPRGFDGSVLDYLTLRDIPKTETLQSVLSSLESIGLQHLTDGLETKSARNLSGGQLQRLAIVRALVNECDVLLMDEPTSALDKESSQSVEDLIFHMKGKCTILIVTHNNKLDAIADRIVEIK